MVVSAPAVLLAVQAVQIVLSHSMEKQVPVVEMLPPAVAVLQLFMVKIMVRQT
jgi:hypothetical protein